MASRGKMYVPTDPDREFVSRAMKSGTAMAVIADCLNIDVNTMKKHFRFEIMTARQTLKNKAVSVLDDSLDDGSLDAAKFVLSRIAGWV